MWLMVNPLHVNEDIPNAKVFFQHSQEKASAALQSKGWGFAAGLVPFLHAQGPFAAVAIMKSRAKDLGPPCSAGASVSLPCFKCQSCSVVACQQQNQPKALVPYVRSALGRVVVRKKHLQKRCFHLGPALVTSLSTAGGEQAEQARIGAGSHGLGSCI